MKIIFLAFFFLLFFFFTTLPSTTAADFVYDEDGDEVFNGVTINYYIVPALRGRGGGLELGKKTKNETCSFYVVQSRNDTSPGLPALLRSPEFVPYLEEGMPFRIRFDEEIPPCVRQPAIWEVVDEFPTSWSVKVSAYENGEAFKLEKSEKYGPYAYKFVYCRPSDNVCGYLGIKNRRLVVRDENPFIVKFRKGHEIHFGGASIV
ncbi:hypothetical protein L6164_003516 [Bauhinia variegata]|uniref:Uncharacterized protein n=1 Tax=Bauhinia variegata TaxID=167791 RepID=A0ACB9Q323_BAUVA|nr:hypothetical protein L6164_003516 [Bauhinia variegata]